MKSIIRKLTPESYFQSYASLMKIGFPVLVTQLGVIIVNFADTMMVGMYGLNELAASALSTPYSSLSRSCLWVLPEE